VFKGALERASGAVRPVGRIGAAPASAYAKSADRLLEAAREGDVASLERLRARVPRLADDDAIAEHVTLADARVCCDQLTCTGNELRGIPNPLTAVIPIPASCHRTSPYNAHAPPRPAESRFRATPGIES
jgi:hypothetical protein